MKPKTKKVINHKSDESDNDSELEIQNKSDESNEKSQVTDSDVSDDLEQEVKKIGPQCVRVTTAFFWYVNTVLFSMYSYFRKGCRKAYAPIPLGILGVYAWVLIEQQPFLN